MKNAFETIKPANVGACKIVLFLFLVFLSVGWLVSHEVRGPGLPPPTLLVGVSRGCLLEKAVFVK